MGVGSALDPRGVGRAHRRGVALSIVRGSSGHVVRTSIAMAGSIAAIVLWIRFAVRN